MPICLYAAGGSLAEPGFGCRDMLRMVRTELHEQPLLLAGDVSSGHSVSSQLLRTDMARTRRGRRRRADAYVAGRTKPTAGLAQLSANPTGHPVVSPTGHQSCRGTRAADLRRNRADRRPLRGVVSAVFQYHPD